MRPNSRRLGCDGIVGRRVEYEFQPDGQITSDFPKWCQAPFAKIFRFAATPNQIYNCRRPVPEEGRFANVTKRGAGCGGRGSVGRVDVVAGRAKARERSGRADGRRCGVRQRRVVLAPVAGVKPAEVFANPTGLARPSIRRRRWQDRIRRRGEHVISRKAIARGMPECFR